MSRTVSLCIDSLPVQQIPLSQIRPNSFNPSPPDPVTVQLLRKDIRENKIHSFDPLLVRQLKARVYELIDGEKRWVAAKHEHVLKIACRVVELDEVEARELCYRRANERGVINPFREAMMFKWAADQGKTYREIASTYIVTEDYVKHRVLVLNVAPRIRRMVPCGTLPPSMWEIVATVKDAACQEEIVSAIVRKRLTVIEAQRRAIWLNTGRVVPKRAVEQEEKAASIEAQIEEGHSRVKKMLSQESEGGKVLVEVTRPLEPQPYTPEYFDEVSFTVSGECPDCHHKIRLVDPDIVFDRIANSYRYDQMLQLERQRVAMLLKAK